MRLKHWVDLSRLFFLSIFESGTRKIQELQQAIQTTFGRLDGLLHNAAMLGPRTTINNYSPDVWSDVFQVNTHAPFQLTKYLLPLLLESQQASVVFTGSSVGITGRAYWGAYAASKAAGENLMQTLADELEGMYPIRIKGVNPGATRTDM